MKIIGIAIQREEDGVMEELKEVEVTREAGLNGDFSGKPGPRQVTLLSQHQWEMAYNVLKLKTPLPWTLRRANLCIQGIFVFSHEDLGRKLNIRDDLILQITGENNPCERMDEAHPGLRAALTPGWRGGATCKVIRGGHIRIGSDVIFPLKAQSRLHNTAQ